MNYAQRLQAAMDGHRPPKSRKQVAEALGISQQALGLVLRGVSKSLTAENNTKAARLLGVNPDWLATGIGEPGDETSNVSAGPDVRGSVPLLNKVNAGMYKEIIDTPPDDVTFIPTAAPVKPYTFALRVEGDSMEPKFTEGMVIIVEPDLDPLPNDYVVAVNGDNEATFKQLIKDGGDWLLKPLNPRYPIKPLGHARVIGVVIGAHITFSRGD